MLALIFRARLYPLARGAERGAGFFLAELAARAPADSDLRNSFFCEMRRRLWARSYGVAAARGGLSIGRVGSPACARSDFRAGLYPLAAVRRIVAARLAGPAVVLFRKMVPAALAAQVRGRGAAPGLASSRLGGARCRQLN